MEAGSIPRIAPPRLPALSPRRVKVASDARLVAYVREGRSGAFETLYDRHHRGILSFCRHLLGDQHEAEDAVQHTFMAAYSSLLASHQPINLRPWLFTIARNRCYSILRAQRERPAAELDEPVTDGLAVEVERRQDLRDLVMDLGRLPEDQRAAIVLAELESLSHAEIAQVLSVPRDKVKALVFQARESLMASRSARDTACHEIRTQLAVGRGGTLRRANLRRHLRDCESCRVYRTQVQRQRRQFAALLPVAPTLLAKEGLTVAAFGAGGAAAVGGSGLIATSAIKTGFLKGVAAAIIAGAGTLGTVVVSATNLPVHALGTLGASASTGKTHHRARVAAVHHHSVASTSTATGVQASDVIQQSTLASPAHRLSTRVSDRHHSMTSTRSHRRSRGAAARDRRAARARRHHGSGTRGHAHGLAGGVSPGSGLPVTGWPGTPVAPRSTGGPGTRTVGPIVLGAGGSSSNPGVGGGDSGQKVPPGWAHQPPVVAPQGPPNDGAAGNAANGTGWQRHGRNAPPGWSQNPAGPAAQPAPAQAPAPAPAPAQGQVQVVVHSGHAGRGDAASSRHVGHIRIESRSARASRTTHTGRSGRTVRLHRLSHVVRSARVVRHADIVRHARSTDHAAAHAAHSAGVHGAKRRHHQ